MFAALDDVGPDSSGGILAGQLTTVVDILVDLVAHPNATVVHLEMLPGSIEDYLALAKRVHSAA